MGRRGPKAQPSALKLERGNPGHRAINADEPALPPMDVWSAPEEVSENAAAKSEWDRLAPQLVEKGVLTIADRTTFATYCMLVGEVHDYLALCEQVGAAQAHQLGYRSYLLKLRVQMRLFASECGVTPSSRSGVKAAKAPPAADDKKRRFFGASAGRPA